MPSPITEMPELLERCEEFDSPAVLCHADAEFPDTCALVLAVEPGGAAAALLPFRLIRDLPLRDVQVVVLSACSSLVGRSGTGVGMEGLTWAFLEAGTPQVLASRYPVADQEICELMLAFYRHLLNQPRDEAMQRPRNNALAGHTIGRRVVGAWALWC